jgi:hypothetical protein
MSWHFVKLRHVCIVIKPESIKVICENQYSKGVYYSVLYIYEVKITDTENCLSILLKIPVPKFKDPVLAKTSPKLGL